jgi:hypothetical protein
MADMFSMTIDDKQMQRRLQKLYRESPKDFIFALEVAGLQFLTWANNGSTKESRKPPIRRGFLRGSGSVFVGGKLVGLAPGNNREANTSHSAQATTVTFGWNAAYAAKMHEGEYNLGPYSQQDGDAGNKWLELHLKADKENFMALVTKEFRKRTGM